MAGTAKKIFQVAKELNVASPAIIEFLEDRGFEVSKQPKHMSPLSEEMYVEVIKRFDPARWQKQIDDEARVADQERKVEAEKARNEQLRKLLDESVASTLEAAETLIQQVEDQKTAKAKKIEKAAEKSRAEEEAKAAEEAAKLAPPPPPPQEKQKPKAPAENKTVPTTGRTGERRGQDRRSDEKKQEKPGGERKFDSRKPSTATSGQPSRAGAQAVPPAAQPADDRRKVAASGAAAPAPSSRKLKASKADIERLEKQKKLLAAQKNEKYKKTVVATDYEQNRRKKPKKKKVDEQEVAASIKQTIASMDTGKKKHRRREKDSDEVFIEDDNKLRLTEFVTTQELANLMDTEVNEVIKKFMSMGKLVSINQRLDKDTIELIADEFGFQTEFISSEEVSEEEEEVVDSEDTLVSRPPVVTVMGHVDHGKTTLLDYLRKTAVAAGEHGGITQHIGAYEVEFKNRMITFLDTPGHEAFTAMRARGAQVTDIVILVVAADDQVRPQTVEAIDHAQSADVPIIVAINKVDRPSADPEKIRKQLADHRILVEQWGGKVQSAEISAKLGQGIDNLLEEVNIAADILELKANPNRKARSTVVEARLDKGRGIVATTIVTAGTLRVGDNFVAGQHYGKVRSLLNEYNEPIKQAGPGQPVQVIGFTGAPQAGDTLVAFDSEREVKEIAMRRQLLQREQTFKQIKMMTLDQISAQIKSGSVRELSLIIKGDADGSVEAICDTLQRLSTSEVAVNIVHKGVGAISESDVLLASATGSIILGFHVHPNLKARDLATREHVDIRVYRIIYEMQNDIRSALEGMLAPDTKEEIVGLVEIRELYHVPKIGTIAGSHVVSGKITRNSQVRLLRDGREIWRGGLVSLKRFKDDAKEVKAGFDCGIGLDTNTEIKTGDTLEIFEIIEIKRKLESSV